MITSGVPRPASDGGGTGQGVEGDGEEVASFLQRCEVKELEGGETVRGRPSFVKEVRCGTGV